MRRYLKIDEVELRSVQIEDLKKIVGNDIESIGHDEDSSTKAIETGKDKKARIKSIPMQAIQVHELLAQSF